MAAPGTISARIITTARDKVGVGRKVDDQRTYRNHVISIFRCQNGRNHEDCLQ